MGKLVSTTEASKILGVSRSTTSRWFDQGFLTGEKNPLTNWRKIDITSIEMFLLKNFNISLPKELEKEEEKSKLDIDKTTNTN